jgi:predicted O-methyltransferase YrrM
MMFRTTLRKIRNALRKVRAECAKVFVRIPRLPAKEEVLGSFDFSSGLGDAAWLLYGLARSMKPEVCVEIGSARGKSACYIGLALKRNGRGKLYAIDPHTQTNWNDLGTVDTLSIIRKHLRKARVADYVEIVRKTSAEAAAGWSAQIDMLFIDGDHTYEGVKADWERFSRFMNPFGIVVFHDTLWDLQPDPNYAREDMGVPRFVDELRMAGYPAVTINKHYGVTLVQPVVGGTKLR